MRVFTSLKDVFISLTRNPVMAFAAISTATISLLIFGLFLILQVNLRSYAKDLSNRVEIRVFLVSGTPNNTAMDIKAEIGKLSEVTGAVYITPEEGLAQMQKAVGPEMLTYLEGDNPLPGLVKVKVTDPVFVDQVAQKIKPLSGVDTVDYGTEQVRKIQLMAVVFGVVGWVLTIVMLIATFFIVANTIQLTVDARKTEIRIMQLVGATDWFIRWPFVFEGLFYGLVGSLIGGSLLGLVYYGLHGLVQRDFTFAIPLVGPEIMIANLLLIPLVGALVGTLGSLRSMRKALGNDW